jgi:hypothetical protein
VKAAPVVTHRHRRDASHRHPRARPFNMHTLSRAACESQEVSKGFLTQRNRREPRSSRSGTELGRFARCLVERRREASFVSSPCVPWPSPVSLCWNPCCLRPPMTGRTPLPLSSDRPIGGRTRAKQGPFPFHAKPTQMTGRERRDARSDPGCVTLVGWSRGTAVSAPRWLLGQGTTRDGRRTMSLSPPPQRQRKLSRGPQCSEKS